MLVLCGPQDGRMETLGKAIEEYLHNCGRLVYYLGLSNQLLGLDEDLKVMGGREEFLRRLGETAGLGLSANLANLPVQLSDLAQPAGTGRSDPSPEGSARNPRLRAPPEFWNSQSFAQAKCDQIGDSSPIQDRPRG